MFKKIIEIDINKIAGINVQETEKKMRIYLVKNLMTLQMTRIH